MQDELVRDTTSVETRYTWDELVHVCVRRERRLHKLAAALHDHDLFGDHVIAHRRMLKRGGRAKRLKDTERLLAVLRQYRRAIKLYRSLLSEIDLTVPEPPALPAAHVPDADSTSLPAASAETHTLPVRLRSNAVVEARLPNKSYDDARYRALLVLPVLNGAMSPEACASNWRAVFHNRLPDDPIFGLVPIPPEAREKYQHITPKTLRSWVRRVVAEHRTAELEGRAPRPVADILRHEKPANRINFTKRSPALDQLIVDTFLHENHVNWSAQNVLDHLRHEKKIQIPVTLRTVQRIIATIPDNIRGSARGGPSADDVMFRMRLLRESPYANHTWIMDHSFLRHDLRVGHKKDGCRDFDFECDLIYETLNYAGATVRRRLRNLYVTAIIDAHTRYPVALGLWPRVPTARETLVLLWQACTRHGVPDRLYTDNGSDFTSHEVQRAAKAVGITHVFSLPYTPEGRGKVERFFGTLKSAIMPHIRGYRGGRHMRIWADDELETLVNVETQFQRYVEELYSRRIHSETKRRPIEHFQESVAARGLRGTMDPAALMPLLVSKDGVVKNTTGVRIRNRRYYGPDLVRVAHGTKLRIYYDPFHLERVHAAVLDAHNQYRYLGPLDAYGRGHDTPSAKEVRDAEKQFAREMKALAAAGATRTADTRRIAERSESARATEDHFLVRASESVEPLPRGRDVTTLAPNNGAPEPKTRAAVLHPYAD